MYVKKVCINLWRRCDRWRKFLASFPQGGIHRQIAVDGSKCDLPDGWINPHRTAGAWGCYLSHMQVLKDAIAEGVDELWVFEDDAVPIARNYSGRLAAYLSAVDLAQEQEKACETDCIIYLGGQHLHTHVRYPRVVNGLVSVPHNVNRLHAVIYRGANLIRRLHARLLNWQNWPKAHHIDHRIGEYVEAGEFRAYCPAQTWLVGQRASESDIAHPDGGNKSAERNHFWDNDVIPYRLALTNNERIRDLVTRVLALPFFDHQERLDTLLSHLPSTVPTYRDVVFCFERMVERAIQAQQGAKRGDDREPIGVYHPALLDEKHADKLRIVFSVFPNVRILLEGSAKLPPYLSGYKSQVTSVYAVTL
jgi:hypothetical protein